MHCDMVFCGDNAHFQLPFTGFNLVPEVCRRFVAEGLWASKASQWLMLGEPFKAKEAKACGLVNEVYLPENAYSNVLYRQRNVWLNRKRRCWQTKALLKSAAIRTQEKPLEKELRLFAKYLKLDETPKDSENPYAIL